MIPWRRRRYWIEPAFQRRMILRWSLLVLFATVVTYAVTIALVLYQDKGAEGTYFFVQDLLGSDPVAVKRHQIAVPALLLSGAVSFLVTCAAGLLYSHRLAGPVYRFRKAIEETLQGRPPEEVRLRKGDEMKELAELLTKLIRKYPTG